MDKEYIFLYIDIYLIIMVITSLILNLFHVYFCFKLFLSLSSSSLSPQPDKPQAYYCSPSELATPATSPDGKDSPT